MAGTSAKLSVEPSSPKAGPTLPIHDIAEDIPVSKSCPKSILTTDASRMINRYVTINSTTVCDCSRSCVTPSMRMRMIALGCCCWRILARNNFVNKSNLSTFIPPDVEPAQAQIIDTNISNNIAKGVQMLVLAVAKPVVDMSDVTWNSECRKASPNEL